MNPSSYDKLVKENVTKTYKKSNDKLVGELNAKSAKIAERLKLDDRIEKLATNEAFVTLKDHKQNFSDHPTCRLINPSKSDINASVISSTKINQWKNTASVLKWFNSLNNKSSLSFICFDVCEFYPSITEKLLSKALNFASEHRQITSQEREIISCGYTCLLPKVTLWVIALGWDRFGFPVRFSPPVTLQIITQGQLLTWQYLEGNLIHHGDRKPRNIRLACGCSSILLLIRQYPVDLAIQNFVL